MRDFPRRGPPEIFAKIQSQIYRAMSRRASARVARRLVEDELQGGEEEEQGEPQDEDGDEDEDDEDEDEDEEDCNLSDDVASDDDAPITARPRKLRRKRSKQPAASAVEEAELSDSEQPAKRNRKPRAGRQGRKNSGFGVSWVLNRVVLEKILGPRPKIIWGRASNTTKGRKPDSIVFRYKRDVGFERLGNFLKHVTSERFRWPVAGVSRCDGKEAGRGSDRG